MLNQIFEEKNTLEILAHLVHLVLSSSILMVCSEFCTANPLLAISLYTISFLIFSLSFSLANVFLGLRFAIVVKFVKCVCHHKGKELLYAAAILTQFKCSLPEEFFMIG